MKSTVRISLFVLVLLFLLMAGSKYWVETTIENKIAGFRHGNYRLQAEKTSLDGLNHIVIHNLILYTEKDTVATLEIFSTYYDVFRILKSEIILEDPVLTNLQIHWAGKPLSTHSTIPRPVPSSANIEQSEEAIPGKITKIKLSSKRNISVAKAPLGQFTPPDHHPEKIQIPGLANYFPGIIEIICKSIHSPSEKILVNDARMTYRYAAYTLQVHMQRIEIYTGYLERN
jgi:hypothetical protein